MIVCKFGGTSVAGKESALNIKKIIDQNSNRKIIVVSALGKNDEFEFKVTDKLFELYYTLDSGEKFNDLLNQIFLRYEKMSEYLQVKINWEHYKNELLNIIKSNNFTKDFIVSRGEYYSAILYSKYLNAEFLDAKNYIIFNKNGKINKNATKNKLNCLNFAKKYVIGGYYGADKNGVIKVFTRGGSDITGAIIADCVNAEVYENYTDVDGIYNKNPNLFKGAKKLQILNCATALALADAGAEVVHKDALAIALKSNMLLIVKSTNHPELGTIITKEGEEGIFVCKQNLLCVIFSNLNKDKLQTITKYAEVDKVVFINQKHYVLLKSVYLPFEIFEQKFETKFLNVVKFTIFEKLKISIKNHKNLKKIAKKVEKTCIFADFLGFFNNFTIICEQSDEKNIVKIINKFLQ